VRFLAGFLALVVAFSVLGRDVFSKDLPPEARETLSIIKQGGPFPHVQDGKTFANREKLLPQHAHGYYREYTVQTPGEAGRARGTRDRGARRIVAGNGGEFYYTDDHYRSFRRIRE